MVSSKNIETLHIWDTEYSADSVEWCPIAPYKNMFVCGTYQLAQSMNEETKTQNKDSSLSEEDVNECSSSQPRSRLGRLYLFTVKSNGLSLLQTLELSAILDTKWCHCKVYGKILLAVANADGCVQIYEISTTVETKTGEEEESKSCLSLLCNRSIVREEDGETLALSLDWSTGRCKFEDLSNDPSITVSDSRGHITVLKLTDLLLEKVDCWNAHGFEAWITAFDYWNSSIVYTGGDDCVFHVYDLRIGTKRPISSNRAHEAGVTSLHSNAMYENLLASGSYDENLRIWDTRHMRRPIFSTPLGGGVWRLKWDPHRWQHLLAACMHGGFRVLNYTDIAKPPSIVGRYEEHESLAYGSDWCHLLDEAASYLHDEVPPADDLKILATCSFYDHKLCVSVVKELSVELL